MRQFYTVNFDCPFCSYQHSMEIDAKDEAGMDEGKMVQCLQCDAKVALTLCAHLWVKAWKPEDY